MQFRKLMEELLYPVPDGFLLCMQLLEVGIVDAACLVDAAGELV